MSLALKRDSKLINISCRTYSIILFSNFIIAFLLFLAIAFSFLSFRRFPTIRAYEFCMENVALLKVDFAFRWVLASCFSISAIDFIFCPSCTLTTFAAAPICVLAVPCRVRSLLCAAAIMCMSCDIYSLVIWVLKRHTLSHLVAHKCVDSRCARRRRLDDFGIVRLAEILTATTNWGVDAHRMRLSIARLQSPE